MITQEMANIMNAYLIYAAIWYVTHTIGMRKLFKKAGVTNKALAYIPFWREVELFKLTCPQKNLGLYWLIVTVLGYGMLIYGAKVEMQFLAWFGLIVAAFSLYLWFVKCYKEARAYNSGVGTFLGLVFFNMIFTIYLGYSNACEYKGIRPVEK